MTLVKLLIAMLVTENRMSASQHRPGRYTGLLEVTPEHFSSFLRLEE